MDGKRGKRTSVQVSKVLLSCRLVRRSKPGRRSGSGIGANRFELCVKRGVSEETRESERDAATNLSASCRSRGRTAAMRSASTSVGRRE